MKEVKMKVGRMRVRFFGKRGENEDILNEGILYADDLLLSGEFKEDLKGILGWFFEVYRRDFSRESL